MGETPKLAISRSVSHKQSTTCCHQTGEWDRLLIADTARQIQELHWHSGPRRAPSGARSRRAVGSFLHLCGGADSPFAVLR